VLRAVPRAYTVAGVLLGMRAGKWLLSDVLPVSGALTKVAGC
jgi:hypothetical protein